MASVSKKYDANDSHVIGVSRSGRICKKSSKLMLFHADIKSNNKRTKLLELRQKFKRSKKIIQNINTRDQPPRIDDACSKSQFDQTNRMQSNDELAFYKTNPLNTRSKPNIDDLHADDSDTASSSTVTNNELLTPDYTSYDEDSSESDHFILSNHEQPVSKQTDKTYSNVAFETKTNLCLQNYTYTGYKLWANEMKVEILKKYPNIDVSIMTIRLGEMWTQMSIQNRNNWHEQAQRLTAKADSFRKLCVMEETSRSFKLQPIDIAAHLSLLGESLILIGTKIKQQGVPVTKSDYTTALMDSLLCAMTSLLCITQQIPLLKTFDNSEILLKTLDNIAYIMPGL